MSKSKQSQTIFASTSRTETVTWKSSARDYKGIELAVKITAGTSLTITPKIRSIDPITGAKRDVLIGAVMTGVSSVILVVYPGISEVANLRASNILAQDMEVEITHGDATACTYVATVTFIE